LNIKEKPFIVGIAGGSGSGKTFFINALKENLGEENFCLFSQDNYYYPIEKQTQDENGIENFDLPQSLDLDKYLEDLKKISLGKEVIIDEYTFNNPEAVAKKITFKAAPIVLAEGMYIFYPEKIANVLNLKIFIEVPDSIRLKRRILRDNKERGYDLEDVLYRYEKHVIPAYKQYILPYRDKADIILPNIFDFKKGVNVLIPFFKLKLAELKAIKLIEEK